MVEGCLPSNVPILPKDSLLLIPVSMAILSDRTICPDFRLYFTSAPSRQIAIDMSTISFCRKGSGCKCKLDLISHFQLKNYSFNFSFYAPFILIVSNNEYDKTDSVHILIYLVFLLLASFNFCNSESIDLSICAINKLVYVSFGAGINLSNSIKASVLPTK